MFNKSQIIIKQNPKNNPGLTEQIRQSIIKILVNAKLEENKFIDLKSGEIHKYLGLYNRMPAVCNAMVSLGSYKYEIIKDTPSGKSSTKLIRYYL